MELLTQPHPQFVDVEAPVDERAARRSLREQIARLERELGEALASAHPRAPVAAPLAPLAGPRLLDLGELELVRDGLASRLREVRDAAAAAAERQEAASLLIERMLLAPAEYKWVRVTHEDVGETSCKSWHVRPRFGLVGMLMGWWRVKISSGCPLATARPRGAGAPIRAARSPGGGDARPVPETGRGGPESDGPPQPQARRRRPRRP